MTPVRVGTHHDIGPAIAVWQAALGAHGLPPSKARTAQVRAVLRSRAALLLVAGDPVVGMLLLQLDGTRLELTMLAVAPDHQGTGVAHTLVKALLSRYPTVTGWTETPLLAEALGFIRTGEVAADRVEFSTG